MTTHPPSWTGHKVKNCMFLMQKAPLHTRFVILPQSWIVCLTLKMPYCTGIAPTCSRVTDYLRSVLSPSLDCHWCLPAGSTFSGNNVTVVVRTGDSGHTIVTLVTKPCQVSGFSDHLQYDNDATFVAKATWQWANSQDIWWPCHAPYHLQASHITEH